MSKNMQYYRDNNTLVLNKIRTPDGTELTSYHVHDYKTHKDKNGETYMVDGGQDYLRRNINKIPYEEMSLTVNAEFTKIRENMYWGSRGVNGDQALIWNKISEMETSHIEAVLENCLHISTVYKHFFGMELEHRAK